MAFLFVGLFLFGMTFTSSAQAPAYTGPNPATLSVCQNSTGNDIDGLLTVTDPDNGQTLTWSQQLAPAHGVLTIAGTETSNTGSVTPSGFAYTPNGGYYGSDVFHINVSDGGANVVLTVNVTVTQVPAIAVASNVSVCHGVLSTGLNYSTTTNFTYTGTSSKYNVPVGVTSLSFDIRGGSGGADSGSAPMPGLGGRLQGSLAVAPGDELTIHVGGAGNPGSLTGATGGYNGGGASWGYGGSGGGATDIYINGSALSDLAAIAGGGAGSGHNGTSSSIGGGAGGGLTAGDGMINGDGSMATGGSGTAGGNGATFATFFPGMNGAQLMGGLGSESGVSGGGGGGYFGGGGGAWSGGGGGSSFVSSAVSAETHTQGFNIGNGQAVISYAIPSAYTYSISWDAAAITAGFTNVPATAFPSASALPVTIPSAAAPDTYNGTLTISNGSCTQTQAVTVTVKPIPDVNATGDQAVCDNTPTADVNFTGSLSGTNFDWTNNNTSINLASSGSSDILAFTATNNTADTTMGMVIVTPELNSCFGTPDTFVISVYPTPQLSVATANVCDNSLFDYTATSATDGTTFAWSRPALIGAIVAPPANGGNGVASISETLDNTSTEPVAVHYTYTLSANGCGTTQDLVLTVNPTPVIDPLLLLTGGICSGAPFNFTQGSTTAAPVTYSWSRAAITGISNAANSGTGDISEILTNTTPNTVVVTYIDTLHINGCTNTQPITVSINPMPMLSSTLTPTSVCNNSVFDYNATSATTGTTITWERAPISGITSPGASGLDTINETHTNTTENPIAVVYVFRLSKSGCTNFQNVTVSVNPTPVLNTTLTPAAICDSTFFNYTPGSNTNNASFAWSRAAVANITNPAASGTNNPNERLRNSASFPVSVTYVFNTTINGCSNAQNVVVTVNPKPKISNVLPTPICDSTVFTFNPTSTTLGSSFAWNRPFISGIGALAASGAPNVNELLKNNTNTNITVSYIYTITANGCVNTQTIPVVVHPKPKLSSHLSDSACSGLPFRYTPTTNLTPSVTYAWTRAAVTGVAPNTAAGTNSVNETLVNSTSTIKDVVYIYTITVGAGCSKSENLNVKLRPSAAAPLIDVVPPANLCAGTMYQNFGSTAAPATGVTYTWSAVNAEVYAVGADGRYSVVNFANSGAASVILTATIGTTGCVGVSTYTVNVTNATSPAPSVIYTNGTFICLQNDVKSFQWGYDDATTLDSVVLKGEINQSYFNATPSFTTRHYWVMTGAGDCMKKTYYNRPADNTPKVVTNINEGETIMRLFPNPATENVTVELSTAGTGSVRFEVTNMLGQVVENVNADGYKANINVGNLPAGIYIVDCFLQGAKVGTAKFVKN